MEVPHQSQFSFLKAEADRACDNAKSCKNRFTVNYADLHCYEVLWCVDEDDEARWIVKIEEASPDECEFQNFIREQLGGSLDGTPIEVLTEW